MGYYFSERQRSAFTFDDLPESQYRFLNRQGDYIIAPQPKTNFVGAIAYDDIVDIQEDLTGLVQEKKERLPEDGDLVNILGHLTVK